jgi:integrase
MNRATTHKPFPIQKHNNIRWRVTFAKGELHPTKGKKKDFRTEKEAKAFVKEWIKARNSLGSLSKQITVEDAADAVKAQQYLPRGVTLERAARFTAQQLEKAAASKLFREGYQDFLAWSEEDHRSKRHLRDHRQTFKLFTFLWEKKLTEITRDDIESKLKSLPRSTKNLKVRHLSAVFNHCISKDWLEINPVSKIKQAKPEAKDSEIKIFSSSDVKKFMDSVSSIFPEAVPYFAISFFAGTRPEEITKLKWENINEDDITISAFVNKTNTLRYTTINKTLRAWLEWHRSNNGKTVGLIFPKSTKTLERNRRKIAKAAGIKWIQDGARKTFASAHYKTYGEEKTIRELGHRGNQMLHKHYNKNIREGEAKAFWDCLPPVRPAKQSTH